MVAQAVATIALGLLGASGVAKLVDPEPTTGALRATRLPSSNVVSRLLGATEVVVAVGAVVTGGVFVIAATGLYLAFGVFTFAALAQRIPLQSCGCFGREDTPPSVVHVVFNASAALALASLPILGVEPVPWSMPVVELALYAGFAAIGIWASYLLLARLPQLTTVVRSQ